MFVAYVGRWLALEPIPRGCPRRCMPGGARTLPEGSLSLAVYDHTQGGVSVFLLQVVTARLKPHHHCAGQQQRGEQKPGDRASALQLSPMSLLNQRTPISAAPNNQHMPLSLCIRTTQRRLCGCRPVLVMLSGGGAAPPGRLPRCCRPSRARGRGAPPSAVASPLLRWR